MSSNPPQVENAPGLRWRARANGWEAVWRPRTDLDKRGFTPKFVRLWTGLEPNKIEQAWISDRCNVLQAEMLVWGRGGVPAVASYYDKTIKTLINCYTSDKDSAFHGKRFKTRDNYTGLMRRIASDTWTTEDEVRVIGEERIADIKARTLLRWHEKWSSGGKIAMGHSLIGMMRTLFGFGATILEDPECERLCGVLHKMKFKMAKPRTEQITAEQVVAIRRTARLMGMRSIALAQALQFELMLRQKDVIGEWVPINEPGTSDVLAGNYKWIWGMRWSDIDDNMILRKTTSKRQKDIEVDLKLAPMVLEEFGQSIPSVGPVIVNEKTGVPYITWQFRAEWRAVARAAGIPDAVKNMDSRAGGITEATDAGAELEHVRHAATHGDIAMTQRYSRGSVDKVAGVMQRRVEHRNKKRTSD